MICPSCGANVSDGTKFCPECGKPMPVIGSYQGGNNNPPTYGQPMNQQPYGQPQAPMPGYGQPQGQMPTYSQPQAPMPGYGQPQGQMPAYGQSQGYAPPPLNIASMTPLQAAEARFPMKWYKFLIYFALIAGALLNLGKSFMYFSGTLYGDVAPEQIYSYFEGLRVLDIFMGIASIAVASLGIVAWYHLLKFKKRGPVLLYALYGICALINIVYCLVSVSIASGAGANASDIITSNMISPIISNLIWLSVNFSYFNKRKELFVN